MINDENETKLKFIRDLPFEKRLEIINELKIKYPDRIPLLITDGNKKLKPIKLLVPSDLSIMNVLIIVRNRIKINSEETIFLFANTYTKNNKIKESFLCNSSETISIIYNKYKDDDNMLYLTYCKENVFG